MFHNIEFLNPSFFWLFLLIPALVAWYWWNYKNNFARMTISGLENLKGAPISLRQRLVYDSFLVNEPAFFNTLKGFIDSTYEEFKNEN